MQIANSPAENTTKLLKKRGRYGIIWLLLRFDLLFNDSFGVKIGRDLVSNCAVFPLAHCGTYGAYDRNRGQEVNEKLELQKQDRYRIKQFMDDRIDDLKGI